MIIKRSSKRKLDALDAHVLQFYEWLPWIEGRLAEVPADSAARREWLRMQWLRPHTTQEIRMELVRWYGFDKRCAGAVRRKAFEI